MLHYQWPAGAAATLSATPVGLLCLRGACRIRAADDLLLKLAAPQHALLSASEETIILSDNTTELLVLAWPAEELTKTTQELAGPLATFGAGVQREETVVLGPAPLPLPLLHAARALLAVAPPGALGLLQRRARLWEAVAQQLAALELLPPPHNLSEYDQERLRFARDYLIQHTQLPPTLPELARLAGLNECKLKRGFKALFGQPAFAYLAEWRLLEARQRLTAAPAPTASEVAFELGYASLQHFSAAYKQRFGHSPRALRMA